MKKFSKLKKQIDSLFEPSLKMEMCCYAYPIGGKHTWANRDIQRFCVKLDREIIWDYPKDFEAFKLENSIYTDINSGISALIREYIDTPVDELLHKEFKSEHKEYFSYLSRRKSVVDYQLTDLFKAADRRLGREKLMNWVDESKHPKTSMILNKRYEPVSFGERAKLAAILLSFQKPMTLEEVRTQVAWLKEGSTSIKKKR
jgi:hypothetical protein